MRRILSGHLNNKGVTLITLIIAITIFAIFVTVFSYVMVAKHGSSALYVQSTQAYAVAQAGIEYGIRCAQDSGCWDYTTTATLEKDFGDGSFDLVYDEPNNTLTSTGTVGVAERAIILSSFSSYVEAAGPGGIDLGDPAPYRVQKTIYVPLENNYGEAVDIYKIELVKSDSPTLETIEFDSDGITVWTGPVDVSDDSGNPTVCTFNYTMATGSVTLLLDTSGQTWRIDGTWYCTFWYNESDPQSSPVEFIIE